VSSLQEGLAARHLPFLRGVWERLCHSITSEKPGQGRWLSQLAGGSAREKWEALEALAVQARRPDVAEPVFAALGDSHPFVRWQAARCVSRMKPDFALARLGAMLADRRPRLRSAAADALGMLGDCRATPLLIRLMQSRSSQIRLSATEALARLGDSASVPALRAALADPDEWVRRAAVQALGSTQHAEALQAILCACMDNSPHVRASAVAALRCCDDPGALSAVRRALSDSNPAVRWQALEAISAIGAGQDAEALAGLKQDRFELFGGSIAQKATDALRAIQEREAQPKPGRHAGLGIGP
jgi:HEAT repeat protein